ncbi:MAG: 1-acyl-sn-glycerol-3-phosphate acyltransferase [Chitinophagaceae bacterium]|uniref:1-acyl-sn-glycerol-3-phosphate acyltransferase n=1 Tax=unclassified Paraflavitalea TaxID=2798305 RepID=UPI003D32A0F7|nr:1-acyl-sn-glycerol-3-phosphate acyltransferase [Chitinophagaceae bacterium]
MIRLFYRKQVVTGMQQFKQEGPVLFAVNHPNSFLDAILIDLIAERAVYSLARGDVFRSKLGKTILPKLNILPVYRPSEGVENLSQNYDTFQSCIQLFKNNQQVLIFSEGLCVQEWRLRPLKKGTARLALQAWNEGIPLKVIPVGITYQSFRSFGKNICINAGAAISENELDRSNLTEGQQNLQFNALLKDRLEPLLVDPADPRTPPFTKFLELPIPKFKKALLVIPGLVGWLLHAPFYYPIKRFIGRKTKGSPHYDSIMLGVLVLFYFPFLLITAFLLGLFFQSYWPLAIPLVYFFTGQAYVQIKKQREFAAGNLSYK